MLFTTWKGICHKGATCKVNFFHRTNHSSDTRLKKEIINMMENDLHQMRKIVFLELL